MILCACLTTIIHKAHSARDFFADEFIYRSITNKRYFIIVLYNPKLKSDIALKSIKEAIDFYLLSQIILVNFL